MIRARLLRAALAVAALSVAMPALAAKKPLAPGERLDLNRASVVELMRLPGLGRKKAEAIAALRSRAPFRRLEDVLAVKGVSPGWLGKHRTHLVVGPPASAPLATRPPASALDRVK
ncbi:MAG TPA: helix-hairpin-helix domain-containing protein [Anaeromyxobacteraceae bacterium]